MPTAEILGKDQAKRTLEKMHAEFGGKILQAKELERRLAEDMKHIEAVLKMLDPGYNSRPIAVRRRKPNRWFKRGTMFRGALDVLREATGPMTARDIAERMLAPKGVTATDDVTGIAGALNVALKNHKGGLVECVGDGRPPARWRVRSKG